MANYSNLKAAIAAAIKQNGNQEITGQVLQDVLTSMVSVIGANYTFAGVAIPSTNPGTPDQNVFYLAMLGGTYSNFNNIELYDGISILKWDGSWSSDRIHYGTGVFDISEYHATGGELAVYADLVEALGTNGANVPVGIRKGGMSVKFVRNSGKYERYLYIGTETTGSPNPFLDITNWEKVANDDFSYGKIDLDNYTDYNGIINGSGNWTWQSGGISCKLIPVVPYFECVIVNSHKDARKNVIYTFLKELPSFVEGGTVTFADGYDSLKIIEKGFRDVVVVPSDAKYLYFVSAEYAPTLLEMIPSQEIPHTPFNILDSHKFTLIDGIINSSGNWYIGSVYNSMIIPVIADGVYAIQANSDYNTVYAFLSELPTFVSGDAVEFAYGYDSVQTVYSGKKSSIIAPNNAKYLYILAERYTPSSIELLAYDNNSTFYDYGDNYPIIPNNIFVLEDEPTPIFKKSLYKDPYNAQDLILTTRINSRLKCYEVAEPLNIEYGKIGTSATFTLEKKSTPNQNIFKNVSIHKKSLAELSGTSAKILMIGDSITHGNNGAQSSPIVKVNELLPSRYNMTPYMIGTFAPYDVNGEGRGSFSYEAMAGTNNNPFGTYHFPSVGGDLERKHSTTTKQFQNPFTFPATAADKQNHPEWCFTNNNNYPNETDGVSFADATTEQKNNWHFFIFDFARYLALWGDAQHTPDIITIALGTNDWQPSGVMSIPDIMFAFEIIYSQIRTALPNVKIGVVSAQNCSITLQNAMTVSDGAVKGNYVDEIAPLITNIQKKIGTYKSNGDDNIFEIPLYACGSRWLAFDGNTASVATDISDENNVKKQIIDTNVHLLDGVGSDGYWQYMDGIITAIACIL